MKTALTTFLLFLSVITYAQTSKLLKVQYNKNNVVASAMDGKWKDKSNKNASDIQFTNDTTALVLISKAYYKDFLTFKIYHAGFMKFTKGDKVNNYPYLLTEMNGNPQIFYFREKKGNPVGDGESFILFIAIGESKPLDKLFVGGDFNNQSFTEFLRVE